MGKTSSPADGRGHRVLLVSDRDWFASALGAVLEHEGFELTREHVGRTAVNDAGRIAPDIVIVDEGLPDLDPATVCRELKDGALGSEVPVLVYSPNVWREQEQAAALAAGAWDIIREPIRSAYLVAKLRRLLEIRRMMARAAEQSRTSEINPALLDLGGLLRTLSVLTAVASRTDTALACAVVGPTLTDPADSGSVVRQRRGTARLCSGNTRSSDLCGWLGDTEVAIVAYDASIVGATTLVQRLNELAEEELGRYRPQPLSAGIVELHSGRSAELLQDREPPARRSADLGTIVPAVVRGSDVAVDLRADVLPRKLDSLYRFAAAQDALRQARADGGGVRVVDVH